MCTLSPMGFGSLAITTSELTEYFSKTEAKSQIVQLLTQQLDVTKKKRDYALDVQCQDVMQYC